jgi:hypothetical protein
MELGQALLSSDGFWKNLLTDCVVSCLELCANLNVDSMLTFTVISSTVLPPVQY